MIQYVFHDGGRKNAGYKGDTGDCVVRAIAIAAELDYEKVYNDLFQLNENFAETKRCKVAKKLREKGGTPRDGNFKNIYRPYLESLGWKWVPTMTIGSGCKTHLSKSELPSGRLIVRVSKHLAAVIDGILYDNHDCSRDGTRCVYGYFIKQ